MPRIDHYAATSKSLLYLSTLIFSLPGTVTAESQLLLDELDAIPIVLTPSRIEQPLNESPAAVTIIDRQKIEASGIRSIPELFRLVPGMSVVYINNQQPQVKYHGLDTSGNSNARHLQVLIDGRSIYQSGFSRVLWTDIPLLIEDIERIEVVRSPSTVSHGANAFVGVINIITRNPADSTRLISLSAGSQKQREMALRHSGNHKDIDYRLSLKFSEHGGYDHNSSQKRDGQDLQMVNLQGDIPLSSSDLVNIDIGYKVGDKDGTTLTPTEGRWENSYQKLHWEHEIDLTRTLELTSYHQQRTINHIVGNGDRNWDEERFHLDLQYNQTHSDQLRSVTGGSIRHDRVTAATYFGDDSDYKKNSHQLYANLEWRPLTPLLLHAGAMWDHEDAGSYSTLSPRFAVNYHLNEHHTLRANYSEAVRSPDLLEQFAYWSDPEVAAVGFPVTAIPSSRVTAIASSRLSDYREHNNLLTNQQLKPEEITAHELGWHFNLPQLQSSGDIKLYREKLSQLTALTTSDSTGTAINGGNRYPFTHSNLNWAEINGIEFEGHWSPQPGDSLDLSYGKIFSYHSNDYDLTSSAPRDLLSILYAHRVNSSLQGSLAFHYSSSFCGYLDYATEFNGCSDPATDFTPTYKRLDLSLQQQLSANSTAKLLLKKRLGSQQEFNKLNSNSGMEYTLTLHTEW